MNYALFIARRYLQTKKRSALVSRITSIAVGGVFVGTMTLVIVLSVINGFETELRQRIVGFNTHVLLFARAPEAWADIEPLRGKELFEAQAVDARLTTKVTMRYVGGLSAPQRLVYGTRVLNIVSVLDLYERHITTVALCTEDV